MDGQDDYPEEFWTDDHRLTLVAFRPGHASAIYRVDGPPAVLYRAPETRRQRAIPAVYVATPSAGVTPAAYVEIEFVEVGPALVGPGLLDGDFRQGFPNWTHVLLSPGELEPWWSAGEKVPAPD